MTTQISQTVIYTPPASGLTSFGVGSANLSGLGVSQIFNGTSPSGGPVNSTFCYTVQAPRPAPIWYIATVLGTTTYTIFTVENNPITLTAYTPAAGFFNGGYFQPNPGQKFNIFINSTIIVVPASTLFSIQSVVENTLSQYVDLGTVAYEHESVCRVKPCVRMIVTGNSLSAIPNTLAFDFVDYPVPNTINAVTTFNGLLNAQGIISYGGYGSMSGSSTTQQYAIIGGQGAALMYPGGHGMKFNGTIFLLLNNIGLVSLPPTVPVPSLPSIFDDVNFSNMIGTTKGEVQLGAELDNILNILTSNHTSTSTNTGATGSAIMKLTDMMKNLTASNNLNHNRMIEMLERIDSKMVSSD